MDPQASVPADYVVIAPLFESFRVAAEEQLSVDELIEDLRFAGKEAFSIEGADAIVEHLTPKLRPDDVVVVMSNGGFGGIHEKLLDALAQ